MDKSRRIEHESDSDVDVVGIEEMIGDNNERLKRIIGKVELLTKRKNEAWKLGRKLKAEYEARRGEYEKKMLEVGRTFQGGPPNTRTIEGEPPQALKFSQCFSERSADIALCEDGDATAGSSMSSFGSGGTAWLTSEVMGLLPSEEDHESSSHISYQETDGKSLNRT